MGGRERDALVRARQTARSKRLQRPQPPQATRVALPSGGGASSRWTRSAQAVVGLMTALADAGERAAALEAARAHESLLRAELDLAPDARVAALARELHAADTSGAAATPAAPLVAHRSRSGAGMLQERLAENVQEALGDGYRIPPVRVAERSAVITYFNARDAGGAECLVRVLGPGVATALDGDRFVAELRRAAAVHHPGLEPLLEVGPARGCSTWSRRSRPVKRCATASRVIIGSASRRHWRSASASPMRSRRHTEADAPHLDVKPRHVVLSERRGAGRPWARVRRRVRDDRITRAATCPIGTPAYMSPEQAGGTGSADARSDVYALGCILYHMLGGEPPFAAGTAQATLVRRLTESPAPLRTIRAACLRVSRR